MNQEFVFYNGKKLRKGYTTGSCATAAAAAAAYLLFKDEDNEQIQVQLPNETQIKIPIESTKKTENSAIAFVKKDGGDDVDATDGMLIGVEIDLRSCERLYRG